MFTGIVECEGKITHCQYTGQVLNLIVSSPISAELKIDQSVAHNGICLTVTEVNEHTHHVTAVDETMQKTSIGSWQTGDIINLERCMKMNDRLDGHIVQGHVDTCAICLAVNGTLGDRIYRFQYPEKFAHLLIEKGSVCINGTSLTCFNITEHSFDVAIIPYTYEHTSIRFVQAGDAVNIEFDVIGKYIARLQGK